VKGMHAGGLPELENLNKRVHRLYGLGRLSEIEMLDLIERIQNLRDYIIAKYADEHDGEPKEEATA